MPPFTATKDPLSVIFPSCDYAAKEKGRLRKHKIIHSTETFKCIICPFETRWKETLIYHGTTHRTEKPFKCEYPSCNFESKLQGGTRTHEKIHSTDSRIFPCTICSYRAKLKAKLRRHMATHQTDDPFKCNFPSCDYTAKIKEYITRHKKVNHAESEAMERPFACDFANCAYTAKWKSLLTQHKIIHSSTLFGCDLCSYRTKYKYQLKSHNVEKLYKCDFASCNYATKTEACLRLHQRNPNLHLS